VTFYIGFIFVCLENEETADIFRNSPFMEAIMTKEKIVAYFKKKRREKGGVWPGG